MSPDTLFDMPEPDRPSRQDVRRAAHQTTIAETIALRRKWTIYTHYSTRMGENPWSAMSVPLVVSWVEHAIGDTLTEEQRHPVELIAGWCSRLDDLGMLVVGRTQHEAVRAVVEGMERLKTDGLEVADRATPPVYVDELMACVPKLGWRWDQAAHLMIDPKQEHGHEVLHVFGDIIGLKRDWQQVSSGGMLHYDLNPAKRAQAVAAGAIEVDRTQTVELIRKWKELTKR